MLSAVQLGQPLRVRARERDLRQLLVEDLDVAQARAQRLEARVVQQILAAGEREEVAPVLVGVGKDGQVAVLGLERPAVRIEHALVARRCRSAARSVSP